jgi:tetratricopeptide (TPR) repeat protein/anti-sigma regulatory factor (Ser/Thr protein kinase)
MMSAQGSKTRSIQPKPIWARWSMGLLVITGMVYHASAQDATRLPTLKATLEAATDDTARAMALGDLAFHFANSEPDSTRHYAQGAVDLARRIGSGRALANAYISLGWSAFKQGRNTEADSLAGMALEQAQLLGEHKQSCSALSILANIANAKGDKAGALKLHLRSMDEAEMTSDTVAIASCLYSIGVLYRDMGDNLKARTMLERALEYQRRSGQKDKMANCLVTIGNTWNSEGDQARALDMYQQAAALYREMDNAYGQGMVEENIGNILDKTDRAKALRHFNRALEHYERGGNTMDKAYILRRMGRSETALGRFAEAQAHLAESMAIATELGVQDLVLKLWVSLAELAVAKGDSDTALEHYRSYMSMKDSIQSAAANRELMRLRAEFETEQAEKENALLKTENELRRLNEERLQARWTAAAVLAGALVLLLVLLYRNYRLRGRHTKEVERFNAELQAQRDQVQHMNDLLELKILRSQLNPHFIHNCQNSAVAMVKEGRNVEALAYLQGLSKLMRMVLEHSVNDRITVEEEMAFLRLYVKLESLRLPGLHCEVDADRELLDDEAELPALLVQPFVENALWHGLAGKEGPQELKIHFTATEKGLRCTVRDNGTGRNDHESKQDGHRSLGTELTNERLQLLTHRLQQRGSFTIVDLKDEAGNPAGTEVVIDLEG